MLIIDNNQYFHRKTGLKTAYLLFSNATFDSFLAGLGRIECISIQPVSQNRQHGLTAHCPNIYTVSNT